MNSPCLAPSYRNEAFAEDLDPPAPLVSAPRRRRLGLVLLALVPVVLALASGAATVLVRLT